MKCKHRQISRDRKQISEARAWQDCLKLDGVFSVVMKMFWN